MIVGWLMYDRMGESSRLWVDTVRENGGEQLIVGGGKVYGRMRESSRLWWGRIWEDGESSRLWWGKI